MSLGAHLKEFRKRLIISVIAIVVAAVFGWIASDYVFVRLQDPILEVAAASGRQAALNFDTVVGAFDLRLQIALTIAMVFAAPIWLYQIWAFITPGLHRKERRYAIGFLLTAVPLFLAGCTAGWFSFPHVIQLLISFAPTDSISALSARYYYDLILKLLIAVGISFVLPVILVFLNLAGVLTGRSIIRAWRWAIIGSITFTAIVSPSADVVSMFLLAGPMLVLYFAAAGIALIIDRRRAKRAAREIDDEPVPLDLLAPGDPEPA